MNFYYGRYGSLQDDMCRGYFLSICIHTFPCASPTEMIKSLHWKGLWRSLGKAAFVPFVPYVPWEVRSLLELAICSLLLEVAFPLEMLSSARSRTADLEEPSTARALKYLTHRKSRGRWLQVWSKKWLDCSNSCRFPISFPRSCSWTSQLQAVVFKGSWTEEQFLSTCQKGDLVAEASCQTSSPILFARTMSRDQAMDVLNAGKASISSVLCLKRMMSVLGWLKGVGQILSRYSRGG